MRSLWLAQCWGLWPTYIEAQVLEEAHIVLTKSARHDAIHPCMSALPQTDYKDWCLNDSRARIFQPNKWNVKVRAFVSLLALVWESMCN